MKPCAHKSVQRSHSAYSGTTEEVRGPHVPVGPGAARDEHPRSPPMRQMTRLLRLAFESGFAAAALMTTVSVVAAQQPIVTLQEARKMAQAVEPTVVGALGAVRNADAPDREGTC